MRLSSASGRTVFVLAILFPALWLAAFRLHSRFLDRTLRVTFFDVGQGDSILVQLPGGGTLLVDAGGGMGPWDMGKRELVPELARMGILSLDAILLTHPDQDHGYGFLGVLQGLAVGELWLNEGFILEKKKKPLLSALIALARVAGARVRGFAGTERRDWNGVHVTLVPLSPDRSTNNRALVAALEYGGCRVLLTGDIEEAAERAWKELPGSGPTLLKVAHHGSKTSSTPAFLAKADPKWAVISVGLGNHYGHPSPGVGARLRARRTEVLRTDFHGYVRFAFSEDGRVECASSHGSCGVSRCR